MTIEMVAPTMAELGAFNVPTEADVVRREMAELRQLKDAYIESLRVDLTRARNRHCDDIEMIGNALMAEAESRDWCGEYDTVVEKLNRELHVELPVREHEYEVTATFTVTISVSARDESNADSIANAAFRDIENTIDHGEWDGYSATSSVDHYSYETSEA